MVLHTHKYKPTFAPLCEIRSGGVQCYERHSEQNEPVIVGHLQDLRGDSHLLQTEVPSLARLMGTQSDK